MPFSLTQLFTLRSFGKNSVHAYNSDDTKATIEGSNYFGAAANYLRKGDIIFVSGDQDGTPFHTSYIVASNDGTTVTLTAHAAVTQNVLQVITVRVTALGTASNHYVCSPVAGSLSAVYGVSNAGNTTAISTIGISIDGGDKATLSFANGYSAGAGVSDTSVDANTLSAGEVITIDNNGEGDGAGEVFVTLVINPS